MTSHDVVAAVRRLLRNSLSQRPRVGHAGTLDPLATGLLIVGVGTATKRLASITKLPKTYEAEVVFGATSTTDDAEGELHYRTIEHPPSKKTVHSTLQELTGMLDQVPPVYSAVKLRGVPAHRRMRRGECVTLSPRPITVFTARLLTFVYPRARIRWTVSSGTYIRALARDLGASLETGGYVDQLRRTSIGPIRIGDATPLDQLSPEHLRSEDHFLRTLTDRQHEKEA